MRKMMKWAMVATLIYSLSILTACCYNDENPVIDNRTIEGGKWAPQVRVYGLRFVSSERITAQFDPAYKQPNREGKIDCIQAYMAPAHGNAGPVLVAGDSNGDVPMLTAFPDMKHGLIIDVGRSATSAIGRLATKAKEEGNKGLYLLQPSFERE